MSEVLYEGASFSKEELLSLIIDHIQAAFSGVNIRVVSTSVKGRHKFLNIINKNDGKSTVVNSAGETPHDSMSWRNTNPSGETEAYIDTILKTPVDAKNMVENFSAVRIEYSPELFPYKPNDLPMAVASTGTHEIGHTLGLMNRILGGNKNMHHFGTTNSDRGNAPPVNNFHMNELEPSSYNFDKAPGNPRRWSPINAEYLKFILPKPPQIP